MTDTTIERGSPPAVEVRLRSAEPAEYYFAHTDPWPPGGLVPARDSVPTGLRALAKAEVSDITVEGGALPDHGLPSAGGD